MVKAYPEVFSVLHEVNDSNDFTYSSRYGNIFCLGGAEVDEVLVIAFPKNGATCVRDDESRAGMTRKIIVRSLRGPGVGKVGVYVAFKSPSFVGMKDKAFILGF